MRRLMLFFAVVLLWAWPCAGQVTTGQILGLVLDDSGAAVPDAGLFHGF